MKNLFSVLLVTTLAVASSLAAPETAQGGVQAPVTNEDDALWEKKHHHHKEMQCPKPKPVFIAVPIPIAECQHECKSKCEFVEKDCGDACETCEKECKEACDDGKKVCEDSCTDSGKKLREEACEVAALSTLKFCQDTCVFLCPWDDPLCVAACRVDPEFAFKDSADNFVEKCAVHCQTTASGPGISNGVDYFCYGACVNIGSCVAGIQFADRTCRDSCEQKVVDWRQCENKCDQKDLLFCGTACLPAGQFFPICNDFCLAGCRGDCRLAEEFTLGAITATAECDKACDSGEEKCEEKCKYSTGECKGKCEYGEHECEEKCKPCDAECDKVCRKDEEDCFFDCNKKGGLDCNVKCGRDCGNLCERSCKRCIFQAAAVAPESVVADSTVFEAAAVSPEAIVADATVSEQVDSAEATPAPQ
ncbi:hypothetical protein BGZ52_008174 [Haplosporangium bisporale]|nr:hypothetical protein BGZ52_008174 [Haplosporangium bisporale]